jgi:predicted MFS family arabinose efflux permease
MSAYHDAFVETTRPRTATRSRAELAPHGAFLHKTLDVQTQSPERSVALLALAQALLLTNGVALIAVNGLVGLSLAPARGLATLPVTTLVLGGALSTLPASHFMRRYGRRAGFMLGAAIGALGAGVGLLALQRHSFAWLCFGTFCSGIYNAFGGYYRLAAAEVASAEWKSRAISLTLAGGLIGAFVGPWLGKHTRELLPTQFAASYGALVLVALVAMALVSRLQVPMEQTGVVQARSRSTLAILRQPKFVVAVLSAGVGYGVMNLLMSATPIAMDLCGFSFNEASMVLQWHVVGMFAPSFITGDLIKRFGVLRIILAGAALLFACIGLALHGQSLQHFLWSLLLLGLGWNFLFVGGTTLLTETYAPEEKATAQGWNDALVFASMLASSLTAGVVVTGPGWPTLNRLALPFVLLLVLSVATLRYKNRR